MCEGFGNWFVVFVVKPNARKRMLIVDIVFPPVIVIKLNG